MKARRPQRRPLAVIFDMDGLMIDSEVIYRQAWLRAIGEFQREMPGLDEPPLDNPLGQRIFENVSKEAWKMWIEQMKMIMNEYRLNLGQPEAQEFLLKQMEEYFFGKGSELPPEFKPETH